jgi:anti-sigma regulatory factor (Ser/Thr protein kinase)
MSSDVAAKPRMGVFPGSPGQVQNVRSFVSRALGDCPAADDVVLLASELATNAVLHTASGDGGMFRVAVRLADGVVRVEVHDGGSASPPGVAPFGEPGESGRGLELVAAIATRWGHDGGRNGRVVWFEVEWK